jgi:pilus assembly protein CpaC
MILLAISGPALGQGPAPRDTLAPRPSAASPIPPATVPAQARRPGTPDPIRLTLQAGVGRLVELPSPALTVIAADPRIARVQPASPTTLFVIAAGPGRTTIVATAEDGAAVAEYDVTVVPNRSALLPDAGPAGGVLGGGMMGGPPPQPAAAPGAVQSMIRRLVPGAAEVTVAGNAQVLVLSGQVTSAADARRAEAIARTMSGETRDVRNELSLLGSIQVNVRVRVAEISRQVSRELGFNWQTLAQTGGFLIGLRSGNLGALPAALGATTASGLAPQRLGVGFRNGRFDINNVIDALAADNLITILAEPNLTAQSGETASFLAGGEFPVPVAASATSGAITIEFKPFGVSLAFVPTVLAPDRLNLRIRPEVSELSQNGAVDLPIGAGGNSLRIPALVVRRAETTVELGSGQSFAIAGLLQRTSTDSQTGLAGLSDVPVIGSLFRSNRFQRGETELVIIVTPYLVRPSSSPTALALPTDGFRPATDLDRVLHGRQAAPRPLPPLDAGFILE